MRSHTLFTLLLLLVCVSLGAQTATDALRFSRQERNGGARNIGVMGSLGALGADFGVLSTNPAGLASFRRSEFFLTPGIYSVDTEARLLDGDNALFPEDINRFHIQNGGMVIAHQPRRSRWKTVNFALGLQQLANYRGQTFYSGLAPGSVTDRFVELADGFTPEQLDGFEAGIAYDAGAIYDLDGDLFYDSDFLLVPLARSALVRKEQTIETSGYQNELQLAFAGNYSDKLYLGLTVGIPIMNFEESKIYQEFDDLDTIPFFNQLTFEEQLSTSGAGINAKLGLIYRASQAVRFGVAVHTPTAFALTDNYSKQLTYNFTENGQVNNFSANSPEGTFDYRLATPWRLIADAGFIFGKNGFLSAEVEWVDYSTASFNFTPDIDNAAFRAAERMVNQDIVETLGDALNVRLGGEVTYKIFRFRAGIGFFGTEYANEEMWSRGYSAGFGIREDGFYIDLGYRRQIREEGYVPYQTATFSELLVNTRRVQDLFALTLGIKL